MQRLDFWRNDMKTTDVGYINKKQPKESRLSVLVRHKPQREILRNGMC